MTTQARGRLLFMFKCCWSGRAASVDGAACCGRPHVALLRLSRRYGAASRAMLLVMDGEA